MVNLLERPPHRSFGPGDRTKCQSPAVVGWQSQIRVLATQALLDSLSRSSHYWRTERLGPRALQLQDRFHIVSSKDRGHLEPCAHRKIQFRWFATQDASPDRNPSHT